MSFGIATMENNMEVPQKIKTELPDDQASPLPGIQNSNLKRYMHLDVNCSTTYNNPTHGSKRNVHQ